MPCRPPRDFQLRAAAAAVNGRDVFVIESAGSGKTLAAEQAAKLNASNAGAVLLHSTVEEAVQASTLGWVVGGRQVADFVGLLEGRVWSLLSVFITTARNRIALNRVHARGESGPRPGRRAEPRAGARARAARPKGKWTLERAAHRVSPTDEYPA